MYFSKKFPRSHTNTSFSPFGTTLSPAHGWQSHTEMPVRVHASLDWLFYSPLVLDSSRCENTQRSRDNDTSVSVCLLTNYSQLSTPLDASADVLSTTKTTKEALLTVGLYQTTPSSCILHWWQDKGTCPAQISSKVFTTLGFLCWSDWFSGSVQMIR